MAPTDDDLARALSQLTAFRGTDQLSAILDNYSTLLSDYGKLKSDYEEARDARDRYKTLSKSQTGAPFALVLVDGDGYIFTDMTSGADAGSAAARQLHEAVRVSLQQKGIDCQVIVRVFANVAGLSMALHRAGLIGGHSRAVSPFIAGFNRTFGLCDYVDAGELKENADSKIRALLDMYTADSQCKHIFFAACHDVGYINDLAPHAGNKQKVTLVGAPGIKLHEQFRRLRLGIEEFPRIFRQTPLSYDPSGPTSQPAKEKSTAGSGVCTFYPQGKCKYGKGCKYWHDEKSWTPSETTPALAKKRSFATLPDFRKLLPTEGRPGLLPINEANMRLDTYVPIPDPVVMKHLRSRITAHKLCNRWHLAGHCTSGTDCPYDHNPLTKECLGALEWFARSQPCFKRGACRDAHCIHGHICQNIDCKLNGGKKAPCKLTVGSHEVVLAVDRWVPAQKTQSLDESSSTTSGDVEDVGGGREVETPVIAASALWSHCRDVLPSSRSPSPSRTPLGLLIPAEGPSPPSTPSTTSDPPTEISSLPKTVPTFLFRQAQA